MASSNPTRSEKAHVPTEFDRVARTYDFLTALNPGYNKHLAASAQRMNLGPRARVLDLCCGTGLSTEALVRAYPDAEVVGLDASDGMLERARQKRALIGVRLVLGDAMDPAAAGVTGPFDGILMAYGIRNVPDPDTCIDRLFALLAPGGSICFHEYSVADSLWSKAVWNAVSFGVIIPSGYLVGGTADIYRYLRRSVLSFDGIRAFEQRLRSHGFVDVRTEAMDGWQRGIVHSFIARKPR
jgi:ubiquinone/menaquinone biosynthesis C-methylase UbiE